MIDSIIAFFQNNTFITIFSLIVVYLYKFVPIARDYTNKANTFLAAFSAWFAAVFIIPTPAEASVFSKILAFDPVIPSILIGLANKAFHEFILSPFFKAIKLNYTAAVDK